MNKPFSLRHLLTATVLAATSACMPNLDLNGDGDDPSPDGTYTSPLCKSNATPVSRPNEGSWMAINLNHVVPPTNGNRFVCANGDDYKFFVQFNTGATDLTVAFEPGGACWDYQSCTQQVGMLSPQRLTGVDDDLMTNLDNMPWAALYPHFGRIDNSVPTNKYNHVFFPYCTGDAFTANRTVTYPGPTSHVTIRHHGRRNIEAAMLWLEDTFEKGDIGQLLVIGSSAGAVGATVNYPLVRDTVAPKCGALVNDAGPIFPVFEGRPGQFRPSLQEGLLQRVGAAWGLKAPGGIAQQLDTRFESTNKKVVDYFGHINNGLAKTFPTDRFLITTFKQDLNFSLYSYVGGGSVPPGNNIADTVIQLWQSDVATYKYWIDVEPHQNFGYYLPNFRPDNCAHLVATAPFTLAHDTYGYALAGIEGRANGWRRTEIGNVNLGTAIRQLLDPSQPLPRYDAPANPTQLSFTSAPGVGVANETWYDNWSGNVVQDKQAFINAEKIRCVNTNGYPN